MPWPCVALMVGEQHMAVFRIIGVGSQASAPIEKTADTAVAAEAEFMTLSRLCGTYGKVEIWTENRLISTLRLQALVQKERANA